MYYNEITDFLIPLHRYHYMVRTIIEAIQKFYKPRNIYIITPKNNCEKIKNTKLSSIIVIDDETFFEKNYNLSYDTIKNYFIKNDDEKHREFGWWYQQLIKLGAYNQIEGISNPFVVWDSDLIPIKKWEIYPTIKNPYFRFAILQEKAKNEWIIDQYTKSLYALINYDICDPENEGTFIPHHFIIYHHVLNDLIKNIETISNECWIKSIINLSYNFYRFSEYRTIASFMKINYPNLLKYHSFRDFGKYGERIRIPTEFLKEMENFFLKINNNIIDEIYYDDFIKFVNYKYNDKIPSYIQIEHI